MKERKKQPPKVFARRAFLLLVDAIIVMFSFYFALLLRADGAVEATWWPHNRALLYHNLPWIVAVYLVCFLAGGLYSILWKYAGERDLIRLAGMIGVPTVIVYLVNRTLIHGVLFNSANVMASVFIFLLVGGSRLAWRLFLNHPLGERLRGNTNKDPNRPVMIVGAGEAGNWAINVCKTNDLYGHPVVAVDDDPAKLNQTIHGVPHAGRDSRPVREVQHPGHHHCHPHPERQPPEPCHRPLRFHPLCRADPERPAAGGSQRAGAGGIP